MSDQFVFIIHDILLMQECRLYYRGFILNAAVLSQYEVNTQERWGGAPGPGVLFTYFQFACSYLLTSLLPTHLCLWSRCSKHSCIAPVWTSADGARALFGLDQHPSTCKPGHLSPSHLKIEREESQLWYRVICCECSQCDSSISGLIHDGNDGVNKSSIILSMALKVLSLKCLRCR